MPTQPYHLKSGLKVPGVTCPFCSLGPFDLLGKHSRYCRNWPTDLKWCRRCACAKPLSDFYINRSRKKQTTSMCKSCNKEHVRKQWKLYPQRFLKNSRNTARRLKVDILRRYSNGVPSCVCCGETDLGILCLDHLNGDGREHRRSIEGKSLYAWIRRHDYPAMFQVLCSNCNTSKALGPSCKINHKKSIEDMGAKIICQRANIA